MSIQAIGGAGVAATGYSSKREPCLGVATLTGCEEVSRFLATVVENINPLKQVASSGKEDCKRAFQALLEIKEEEMTGTYVEGKFQSRVFTKESEGSDCRLELDLSSYYDDDPVSLLYLLNNYFYSSKESCRRFVSRAPAYFMVSFIEGEKLGRIPMEFSFHSGWLELGESMTDEHLPKDSLRLEGFCTYNPGEEEFAFYRRGEKSGWIKATPLEGEWVDTAMVLRLLENVPISHVVYRNLARVPSPSLAVSRVAGATEGVRKRKVRFKFSSGSQAVAMDGSLGSDSFLSCHSEGSEDPPTQNELFDYSLVGVVPAVSTDRIEEIARQVIFGFWGVCQVAKASAADVKAALLDTTFSLN